MHSLIPAYRHLHARGKFPGRTVRPYLLQIADLVLESGAESVLDYGCGKGYQWTEDHFYLLWGTGPVPVRYDPAVDGIDRKPKGPFDAVICTDVLEHVPEDELDAVIDDLANYARMWCFVSVCCRESRKRFADRSNVHVTIRPPDWWREKLGGAFAGHATLYLEITP